MYSLHFKGITGPWDETSGSEHSVAGTNNIYWQVIIGSISATVLSDLHIPVLTWDTPPCNGDTGGCGGCYRQAIWRGRGSCNNIAHILCIENSVFTCYSSCFHGYCWWTVSCYIPGYDGNIIVTVLLHTSQSVCSGATRHCYPNIATNKPTVILHEGVSDEVIVNHFSSWLCPGEGDGGGVRRGATKGSRG